VERFARPNGYQVETYPGAGSFLMLQMFDEMLAWLDAD
jgi:hypothetical protein